MRVSELISKQSVLLQARIERQDDALGILVELQESGGVITNGTAYYNAVCDREASGGTTAIGEGIALPHACNAGVAAAGVSAMTLREGVGWGAPDGQPVDLLFMIAVPPNSQSLHMQILARLVSLLADQELVEQLRGTRSRSEFIRLLSKAEAERFA